MRLQEELRGCVYTKYRDLDTWFAEVERLHADLFDLHNVAYTECDIIKHLMNNLPHEGKGLLSTIRASMMHPTQFTLDTVKDLIIAHFNDMNSKPDEAQTMALMHRYPYDPYAYPAYSMHPMRPYGIPLPNISPYGLHPPSPGGEYHVNPAALMAAFKG